MRPLAEAGGAFGRNWPDWGMDSLGIFWLAKAGGTGLTGQKLAIPDL
jgi:hypothetical protein